MPRARATCASSPVGRRGDGVGDGIRLVDVAIDGFAQRMTLEYHERRYRGPAAAGRRIPDRERAGRGGPRHRHRQRRRSRCLPRSNISKAPRAGSNWSASSNGAPVFVDYAHKPDALAKALQALRPYAKRKLVVVFGAGGDRDAGKRPLMGEIAARECRQRHRHRRQSAQRKSRGDPRRDPGRGERRQRDRRPRRGDPQRRLRRCSRATRC